MTATEPTRIRKVDKPQELPTGPRLVIHSKEDPQRAKADVARWLTLYGRLVMWKQPTFGSLIFAPDNKQTVKE